MRWTLKEIHVALVAKWNGPRDGKTSLIGEAWRVVYYVDKLCVVRFINRRFCELPACFRRADNFLLPLYESNLSGRDIEYLFDKQDSYTISKYFFNCEKCIVLDKSRYRCMFNVIHKPRKIEILTRKEVDLVKVLLTWAAQFI